MATPLSIALSTSEFDFVDWSMKIDLSRQLLPLESGLISTLNCTSKEAHAASWALGLIAASAISEHEKVLFELKDVWWRKPLTRLEGSQKLIDEGEHFFEDEAKHAAAYTQFLAMAATQLNLSLAELRSFLPRYKKTSLITWLYRLDRKLGGTAVWWTVAATEEESINLFRMLAKVESQVDPLYFEINRAHFKEEVRHSSYSYKMLDQASGRASKTSFLVSRILQTCWLLNELRRINQVSKLQHRHPILTELNGLLLRLHKLPLHRRLHLLVKETNYISMMMDPSVHPRIKRQLKKTGGLPTLLPSGEQG